jgi:hypothetical protein
VGVVWRGREEEGEEGREGEGERGGRGESEWDRQARSPSSRRLLSVSQARPSAFLQKLTAERFHRAFRRLQRTFARLGVPVICARDSEPARLIIERMNRLRPLGMKR